MYSVLLPVDASEERARNAVSAVTGLPTASDTVAVTILNVFEEFDMADDSGGRVKSKDLFEDYDRPTSVDIASSLLDKNAIEWTFRSEHGELAETILQVADEEDVDMIIMASGNRSPLGKVLFGSVTQGVLLDAEQPVTVV